MTHKDNDGAATLKGLTVCILCLGGMILPASVGMGDLGTAICMLGAVALSIAILKSKL